MVYQITHYFTSQTKTLLWLAEWIMYIIILTASTEVELAL